MHGSKISPRKAGTYYHARQEHITTQRQEHIIMHGSKISPRKAGTYYHTREKHITTQRQEHIVMQAARYHHARQEHITTQRQEHITTQGRNIYHARQQDITMQRQEKYHYGGRNISLCTAARHHHAKYCVLWHIYPPITRKRSIATRARLGSCPPSIYHTKMGEPRQVPFLTAQLVKLPACFPHCPFNAERQAGKL